jgi:putative protease
MCQDSSIPLKEQYLLSTRDLSVYPVLSSILSLPISSLKIEGRMRSPEYVATVTRIYRRAIDDVSLHGCFVPSSEQESDLALAFSRGFTSGYVNDEEFQTVMGRDLPGRRGLLVGIVRETDTHGNIILEPAGDLVPERGDGLVSVGGREDQGFVLRYEPTFRGSLLVLEAGIPSRRGDRVYLTSRGRINREHEELLKNPDYRYAGSLPLHVSVMIHQDGSIFLTGFVMLRNAEKIAFSYQSKEQMSPARSRPLTTETIASSMQKTGGTLFTIQSLDISCPDNLFAPVSVLNSIRRELLEVVSDHIIQSSHPSSEDGKTIRNRIDSLIQKYQNPKDPEGNQHQDLSLIVIVSDLTSAISACEAGAERSYIEWYPVFDKIPSGILKDLETIHLSPQLKEQIGIKFPRILRQKELDIMLSLLPRLISSGVTHIMVDGLGIAEEIANRYPDLHLSGYTGFNITNHIALSWHQNLAFTTLSCELSGKEITETMSYAKKAGLTKPVGILVQGLIEAVITEDRLETLSGSNNSRDVLMIKDQKGESFPIMTDPYGRTHIFNAAETSLLDRIPEILNAGIHCGIIDGRWRSAAYARDMTALWKKATVVNGNTQQKNQADLWRNEAKGYAWGSLTSATWKRGLCGEFSLSDTKQKRRQ